MCIRDRNQGGLNAFSYFAKTALNDYTLTEIDRAARERMDAMLPRMMEAAGVTAVSYTHLSLWYL